ncbi:hypothetical protein ABPG72_010770 [Tetrahymena utriculariae]
MEIERQQQPALNIVLPGEQIDLSQLSGQLLIDEKSFTQTTDNQLYSNKSGVLVDTQLKYGACGLIVKAYAQKYYAEVDDYVIGVIKGRVQEYYLVDIGAQEDALLSFYGFEGATKKNRPNLRDGSLIFCKVTEANKYMKIKVDCIHPKIKKQWMTGESFFGQIKDGMVANISIEYAKSIIGQGDFVFRAFKKYIKSFETAIGSNGKVWIKTLQPQNTILILDALNKCKNMSMEQIKVYVDQLSPLLIKE